MRDITSGVLAELPKQRVSPFIACSIKFADQISYLWTGIGAIAIGANTYFGLGKFAGIAPISETSDLQANGVQLSLSGVPPDVLSESLSQCRQGQPVNLSLGLMDSTGAVIPDPATLFNGRMDTVSIDEIADSARITIQAESRAIDFQKPRIRRYTDDDQQRTNPGDLGFQFVPMVQDWNGPWGQHDRGH